MEEWWAWDRKEVLKELNSSEEGLSEHEARVRLRKFGENELKQIAGISGWQIFLTQFGSIFIIILLLATAFSLIIGHYLDAGVIGAIVLLNSMIGFWQQYKAEKAIVKMRAMLVPNVRVLREGKMQEISSRELVPGDILLISEGDKIMADCRLLHENSLEMNEAVLTGESFGQRKTSEKLKVDTELADMENMIFMGTNVDRGNGRAIVVATGMSTEFGKIASLVQSVKVEKTPLEKKFDDFSKKVAIVILGIAGITALLGVYRGNDLFEMLLAGIALAISSIPEGLPAVIALTLAFAIRRMEVHNALIRRLPAAETLGRTTVICSDKTGTMTEEEMTVTKVYCGGKYYKINNRIFFSDGKKIEALKHGGLRELLRTGILCNNARIEKEDRIKLYGDPTEKALVAIADHAGLLKKEETEKEKRIIEYSFSSKRKLMSIVRKNNSLVSHVKGAPDVVLKRCSQELINGKVIKLDDLRRQKLFEEYEKMASQALRVLGFAYKKLGRKFNQDLAENDLIFLGFQGMIDAPRKEVAGAIRDCLNAGVKVKMITGDSLLTARAVADMVGLNGESFEAHELEKLSEEEFDRVVKGGVIFARITPELKFKMIKSLRAQGEVVAVTGDGVNDVLALKEADIGIAMGIRGTDVAREVSDMILLDDNFSSIVRAVREGRRVYDNIKKSVKFHLAANVNELVIVFAALLLNMPLPLLPLAILWMNLITDGLPSLALTVEKEEKDIMRRKPRDPKEKILDKIFGFILIAGFIASVVTFALFALNYKQDLEKARTLALTASVFFELFLVFTCRSDKQTIFELGIWSNKFVVWSVATAFVLQLIAIYTPLAKVFGFVPLSFAEFLLVLFVSSLGLVFFEVMKIVERGR